MPEAPRQILFQEAVADMLHSNFLDFDIDRPGDMVMESDSLSSKRSPPE